MTRRFTIVLLLSAAYPALTADLAAAEDGLDGAWTAISAERDGAPANELVGHRITFDSDRFQITKDGSVLFGGRFTKDSGKEPAQIDFAVEDGAAKGQSWTGIYKIENNELTVCDNASDPTAPRQMEFTAPKGYVCLTFKR
jgi:uncharacterized protein (TIGR03067 family)